MFKRRLMKTAKNVTMFNENQKKDELAKEGQDNESLKQENEPLKQDNESLKQENEPLKQEIESLKQENEPLKQEIKQDKLAKKGQEIETLKQENENLKQENESLKQEIEKFRKCGLDLVEGNKKLDESCKKLDESCKKLIKNNKIACDCFDNSIKAAESYHKDLMNMKKRYLTPTLCKPMIDFLYYDNFVNKYQVIDGKDLFKQSKITLNGLKKKMQTKKKNEKIVDELYNKYSIKPTNEDQLSEQNAKDLNDCIESICRSNYPSKESLLEKLKQSEILFRATDKLDFPELSNNCNIKGIEYVSVLNAIKTHYKYYGKKRRDLKGQHILSISRTVKCRKYFEQIYDKQDDEFYGNYETYKNYTPCICANANYIKSIGCISDQLYNLSWNYTNADIYIRFGVNLLWDICDEMYIEEPTFDSIRSNNESESYNLFKFAILYNFSKTFKEQPIDYNKYYCENMIIHPYKSTSTKSAHKMRKEEYRPCCLKSQSNQ